MQASFLGSVSSNADNNIAIGTYAGGGHCPYCQRHRRHRLERAGKQNSAIAIGHNANASGLNSVAIGAGAVANQDNFIVLGGVGTTTQVQALTNYGSYTQSGGQASISWAGGNVGDVSTLNGSNAALSVTNGAVIQNGLAVADGVNVTGGTTTDTLHVTGASQFDGNVTVGTQVTIDLSSGNITTNGTVSGNAVSAGSGGVTSLGLITGNNGLTITNGATSLQNTTVNGDLGVTGNYTTTNGNITTTNGTISGNTLSAGAGGVTSLGLITGNNGLTITNGLQACKTRP